MRKPIYGLIIFFGCLLVHTNVKADSQAIVSAETAEAFYEPYYEAEVSDYYEEGEVLDVLSYEDGWICFDGYDGEAYMPMENVAVIQAEGLTCNDGTYLFDEPTPFGNVVQTIRMGSVVNVIGYYDDYYAVDIDGESLYVYQDDIIGNLLGFLEEYGPTPMVLNLDMESSRYDRDEMFFVDDMGDIMVVNTEEGLNIRTSPDADAPVLLCVPNGNYMQTIELGYDWHLVEYDGEMGYVSAKFTEYMGDVEMPEWENSLAMDVIDYAQQFIGTRYRYGGTNLNTGVDCSGFVYSVFKSVGITLNRSSRDQARNGYAVDQSELQTGDLVFFATTGGRSISHVGIYIGNNEFIHSSSSNHRGVIISSLDESYYERAYVSASRVL